MIRRLDVPRRRILWRQITTYTTVYRSRGGAEVTVKSLTRQPSIRRFRTSKGAKKFKAVRRTKTTKEFIIMAKATKKKPTKSAEIEDTELEELEALEAELEDEDDEDEVEDVVEDDEEEEDEDDELDEDDEEDEEEDEPVVKKKGKKTKSRARENNRVGTQEIAQAGGVDSRTLRMVLRKHAVEKDSESGRYEWDSMNDPTVKKILKWLKAGEAKKVKQEGLDRLKEQQAAKREDAKARTKKSGKKSKKKRAVEEDEDDE